MAICFELSKVLNNPKTVPDDLTFKNQMISAYKHSINDDPLVRAYLAIAMGATGDNYYSENLIEGLTDDSRESRLASDSSGGYGKSKISSYHVIKNSKNSDYSDERLAATMSLGFIGDIETIPVLTELLEDEEPNIRWDAAIGLAKMGEKSSIPIIENLMDRNYLMTFPELDYNEINKVILVAIETTALIKDSRFKSKKLILLAESDENLTVRDAAIKTLKTSYDRVI